MRSRTRSATLAGGVAVLGFLLAACSAPAGLGSAAPTPSSAAPTPSSASTPVPSVLAAADAVAIVLVQDPRFAGIGARDPAMVGQGSWYEVTADATGWRVVVQVGWGDCPAGCISRHTWEYLIGPAGAVLKTGETGDQLPAASGGGSGVPRVPIPSSGGPWLVGVATAGPVCPVERNPPDPACAPRPVVGAAIVVLDPGGREVARTATGTDGTYRAPVPAGSIRVEAAPVAGLMGTPAPFDAVMPAGAGAWLRVDLAYDTGIR